MSGPLAVRNLRRRGAKAPLALLDPLQVSEIFLSSQRIPDVMEFILSDTYLDQPGIYPRQATMLKAMFLQDELFTPFDYDVIGQWGEDFARTGYHGCQPDLLERIKICKAQGRPWFREIVAVVGRRGSKGYLGALSGSYVTWHYMHKPGGPQAYYGIERSKKLMAITFAGKRQQAKENQWRDIVSVVSGAPCFGPYISRQLGEILTIYAPSDILRAQRQALRGVESDSDQATFEIVPRESSLMAARGPAAYMQHYDEMAHVVATGVNRSAGEVYASATPSLDQFGVDAFIFAGSSPWQMAGRYYEMWEESIAKEADGSPSFPEKFMVQLESWDPYQDWERAEKIITRPARTMMVYIEEDISAFVRKKVPVEVEMPTPHFAHKRSAIQSYDGNMQQLEKSNPDNFRVERRSRWAAILDSYLDEKMVSAVFGPWQGEELRIQLQGPMSIDYVAHGDPGLVNDAFGYAIGHVEIAESLRTLPDGSIKTDLTKHVVIDVIDCWEPATFEDHRIDYLQVEDQICQYVDSFLPIEQTFDPWNSASSIAHIRRHVVEAKKPKRTDVYEVQVTEKTNWVKAEIFKSAINLGRVHAPMLDQHGQPHEPSARAELEMRFLQMKGRRVDHPSSGPVQSKDTFDAVCEIVWKLIGREVAEEIGMELAALGIAGGQRGGTNAYSSMTSHGAGNNDLGEISDAFSRSSRGAPQTVSSPARGIAGRRR